MPQIPLNHQDTLLSPSSQGSFGQSVWAGCPFRIFKHLLERALTDIQTCQTLEMMDGHLMNHISDPPEYELASVEGTAQVVAGLPNVAQRSLRQQPGKDQAKRGWSTLLAESESLVFVDQKRRHAPRPKPLVVRAEERIAQRGDETDG